MRKRSFSLLAVILYCPFAFADGVSASRVLPSSVSANSTSSAVSAISPRNTRATSDVAGGRTNATATRTTITPESAATDTTASRTTVRSGSRIVNLTGDGASSTSRATGNTVARSHTAESAPTQKTSLSDVVNTVGRNPRVDAAGINANPTVRRLGISLRPTTADVGGRAIIAGTGVQTGSNISDSVRTLQTRAATTTSRENIAAAKERLEQTADLNKSCQEQYNDCMDQFCAVVDANQKRCSCSANLSKYSKVEEAVKDANNRLNDVAQRIRYVGLSADEITAIMSETEAEEALSGKTDTSETRSMLTQIEKMIKDPKATSSYASDDSFGLGLDLNLDFSTDSADLFSLDFLNTGSSSSFSNLRGADLYNAAKKRCNTVLTQCKNAGGTPQQITGNYDLAIDKDCIAYEQGLKKMNETLVSNVRSANLMLQKARLAVLQNKNQYDAKGCIAALETCMTDDMVCGEDYTKCLDPTKKFIDENGKVILGQDITTILKYMDGYDSSKVNSEFISKSRQKSWSACATDIDGIFNTKGDGACNVRYLFEKIGFGQKSTDNGLCRPVLDKCQYYTYDTRGNYKPENDIVVNYIQRAMVNISSGQHRVISDYASSCMTDIASCYNKQVTQVNSWSSSASVNSIYNVMTGACYNVALTCGYAVFQHTNDETPVPNIWGEISADISQCEKDATDETQKQCYILAISKLFYQSLLCPDNSDFDFSNTDGPSANGCGDGTGTGSCYANLYCKCRTGFAVWNGSCVAKCATNQDRNSNGACGKKTSCTPDNGNTLCSSAFKICVPNSRLDSSGKCVCDDGFMEKDGTCVQCATGETSNAARTACICNKEGYGMDGDKCILCSSKDNSEVQKK